MLVLSHTNKEKGDPMFLRVIPETPDHIVTMPVDYQEILNEIENDPTLDDQNKRELMAQIGAEACAAIDFIGRRAELCMN